MSHSRTIPGILLLILLGAHSSQAQWSDPGFFPRAVWLQSTFRANAYKDAGINLYIGLWNELNEAQWADLNNAGMYVMCAQNDFGLSHLNDTLIAGWTLIDEPDNAQWNVITQSYDPCIAPSDIIAEYDLIKTKDPSRPVFLNLGRGVSDINWIGRGTCTGNYEMYREATGGYLAGCDIVCFDIYPVNNTDTLTSEKLWYVPKGIDSLLAWAAAPKPTFAWIETTHIEASGNRGPTPAEVKSEVWMAIIHGATGIGYFCHSWTPVFDDAALLHDAVMIDSVRSINAWIDALAPVLNSPTISGFSSVSSSNPAVPVDFMTKFYDNATYIFAVAMRPGTTSAAFTVPAGATIEVWGENRQLNESDGQFTDEFTDYGVHIYKITALSSVEDVSDQAGLFVSPNPGKGVFQISSSPGLKKQEVRVCDQRGRVILRTLNAESFDLSGQAPGLYFVMIQTDRDVVVKKIVLQ